MLKGLRLPSLPPLTVHARASTPPPRGGVRAWAQIQPTFTPEQARAWVQSDSRRMLHAVYRVGDLDATLAFYRDHLGMQLLRSRAVPSEGYSNAFLGYGPESTHFAVELTKNDGVDAYDLGEGFGHLGVAVSSAATVCESIEADATTRGKVTRPAGPVKGGQTVIAFVKDPTGYAFELIERAEVGPEPLCQVMLRVGDLEKSMRFYEEVVGMKALRTRDNEAYQYTLGFMGYGPEETSTVMELTYNYDKSEYTKGNGYAQVAISTSDVYQTAAAVEALGGTVTRAPGPVPGIGTKICECIDTDGWKIVFVDNDDFLAELE